MRVMGIDFISAGGGANNYQDDEYIFIENIGRYIVREKLGSGDYDNTEDRTVAADLGSSTGEFPFDVDREGNLYVATGDNASEISKIDTNLDTVWQTDMSGLTFGELQKIVVGKNRVIMAARNSPLLAALDVDDGSILWETSSIYNDQYPSGCLVDSEGNIFLGIDGGEIGKVDGSDGSLIDSVAHGGIGVENGSMCGDPDGNIYVTTFNDGTMESYDNSLTQRWESSFTPEGDQPSWIKGDEIIYGNWNIDATDGSQIGSIHKYGGPVSAHPTGYVLFNREQIIRYDYDKNELAASRGLMLGSEWHWSVKTSGGNPLVNPEEF